MLCLYAVAVFAVGLAVAALACCALYALRAVAGWLRGCYWRAERCAVRGYTFAGWQVWRCVGAASRCLFAGAARIHWQSEERERSRHLANMLASYRYLCAPSPRWLPVALLDFRRALWRRCALLSGLAVFRLAEFLLRGSVPLFALAEGLPVKQPRAAVRGERAAKARKPSRLAALRKAALRKVAALLWAAYGRTDKSAEGLRWQSGLFRPRCPSCWLRRQAQSAASALLFALSASALRCWQRTSLAAR